MLLVVLCDCEKEVAVEDLIHLLGEHVGPMSGITISACKMITNLIIMACRVVEWEGRDRKSQGLPN